ncbi:MAG TPA: hypothetical protein VFQ79_08330 [Bryobacteraceae bacterium]|nr:hypothetical protein [Bryobacteraceae bacterium]
MVDGLLLLSRECKLVLKGPEGADGGDIAALGVKGGGSNVQTLNVIKLDLHGFV